MNKCKTIESVCIVDSYNRKAAILTHPDFEPFSSVVAG